MIPFKKYQGCGNHFILIKEEDINNADCAALALRLCDAATGIGGDGLIIVKTKPVLEMRIFNKDGTSAPMCGNGLRCFAAFCYHQGILPEGKFQVKTMAGTMGVEITSTFPFLAKVNMGKPSFRPADCGIDTREEQYIGKPLQTPEGTFIADSLFMGAIHTVIFVERFPTEETAKLLSHYPIYREKTNVNFVKPIDAGTLEVRTYERGVGMTQACGTGACAAVVSARLHGKCDGSVLVNLPGGKLVIEQQSDGHVIMLGPAEKVFEGMYCEESDRREIGTGGTI